MDLAFIIIDDSELDCFIAKKIIEHRGNSIKVTAYTDVDLALRQIRKHTDDTTEALTVILLDLRLPIMDGFEFMEEFETLPYSIREKYVIYVLSSTMNRNDVNRVVSNKNIVRLLNKPLTKVSLDSIFSDIQGMEV